MVMDRTAAGEFYGSSYTFNLSDELVSSLSDANLVGRRRSSNSILNQDYANAPPSTADLSTFNYENYSPFLLATVPGNAVMPSVLNNKDELRDDYDFSDVALKYISQMLMEEDIEDKPCMLKESAALQAAEQSFYELLGDTHPPSNSSDQCSESSDKNCDLNHTSCSNSTSPNSGSSGDPGLNADSGGSKSSYLASQFISESPYSSSGSGFYGDGSVGSPVSTLRIPEILSDDESVMQFQRGFEEASKFIPNETNLVIDLESSGLLKELNNVVLTARKNETEYSPVDGFRRRKNPLPEDVDLDGGRSSKQSSVYAEPTVSSEMFDMVLLSCGKSESALREALQNGTSKNLQKSSHPKGAIGNKNRGKKQGNKKDVVDLRSLLTLCAQSISANDRRGANELLKQIRQHSTPTGDGMQRMAHYFANGLEARLAGSGTKIYTAFITKPTTAADLLKAYHLYLAACPFRKISNFFANKTIMNVAEKATRLHIIDFGTLYGFQWPSLIQRLSFRPGGPPNLRITGIDFAQPGFRPAERVEETGHRLQNYAKTFGVPFEFNAIAQKWDTVKLDDLKLDDGEVLAVTGLYRLRNLLDETVEVDCPRDTVLKLIKKIKPNVFILGVVNGAYNAPFFITRFREALFHFSTLYDMLETNIPREIPERMLIEREIFGWEAMNAIACEGYERVERPESYKQWQARNLRIGFKPLPLNEEIVKISNDRVKLYHKDFLIDEDGPWLLQGWKGRIVYAISTWQAA